MLKSNQFLFKIIILNKLMSHAVFLILGENNEDKISFINTLPDINKLYDLYLTGSKLPFEEYQFNIYKNNDACFNTNVVLCPDIEYTDNIIKNRLFENIAGVIVCLNNNQSKETINKYNQLAIKFNSHQLSNLYIWYGCDAINDFILSAGLTNNFLHNDINYINKIREIIDSGVDEMSNCNIL
jgi:hypothetical protein